jgi:hypothetical protein
MGLGRCERFHSGGSTQVISTGGRAVAAGEGAVVGTGAATDGLGSDKNGDCEPTGSGGFLQESVARVARTAVMTARFTVDRI